MYTICMASLGHNPDDLVEVLAARGISQQCPFCNDDQWFATDPTFVLLDPHARGDFVISGEGMPVIAFACKGCGFIRQHSTMVLHRHAR